MSKAGLIILSAICGLSLILLLIALIPKLKHLYRRMPDILIFFLLIVVLVTGTIVAVNLLKQKAPDALVYDEMQKGTVETETSFGIEEALEGNAAGDEAVYISVHSGIIRIGSVPFKDMSDFSDALSCLDLTKRPVRLVDDYALASVYRDVREHLDAQNIHYIEETR